MQVKVLKLIERVDPESKQLVQIPVGTELDVTPEEMRYWKRSGAVALIAEQVAQPADVSAVVDAAKAVKPAAKDNKVD
ncbi:hypothetical protein ADP64_000019 [Achromobacter phage phiAxp-2]|uniref:Uncharacterized protein n=1 Tax=Achromobacter phage phiAxp-2 TaxID=1664246 RepID=A0A0K2FH98_9CAUD|nr:hypothetical protein ADP64_000019 [Achromobacter phage phiAxp-2]ALA45451.1 hypothetical protein ADP64_000019 [Achromobacter phage phiAxp-2]